MEVYNETLRDLLAAGNTKRDGAKLLDSSAIKHDAAGAPSSAAFASMAHIAVTRQSARTVSKHLHSARVEASRVRRWSDNRGRRGAGAGGVISRRR